jgi:NADP-dependent 3-hydroxy acid dehydrogenase YdfG
VVVTDADTDAGMASARALGAAGAALLLCGTDPLALGVLAAELAEHGVRVAVVVGDHEPATIVEMVHELFDRIGD